VASSNLLRDLRQLDSRLHESITYYWPAKKEEAIVSLREFAKGEAHQQVVNYNLCKLQLVISNKQDSLCR
jgi:hypothetical protein